MKFILKTYHTQITFTLFIVLGAFRFIYLDQDIHSRMIEGLCQVDEAYYIFAGYDTYLKNNNRIEENENKEYKFESGFTLQAFPLVYASLSILGNNYYGARVPIVLFSLLTIILLFNTTKKILNKQYLTQLLLLFFLFSDFYFFINSRLLSPQAFSLFIISLLFFVSYSEKTNTKIKIFTLTFIATIAVLFFYVFNLFLLAGVGFFILTLAIKEKKVNYIYYAFGGLTTAIVIFIIALQFSNSTLSSLYDVITEQNKSFNIIKESPTILSQIKSNITGFISIISTNLFRFNPILLWAFITFSINSTRLIILRKISDSHLLLFYTFLFLTLQSIFVSSFPYRKLVIFLPFTFIALAIIIKQIELKQIHRSTLLLSTITSVILYFYSLKINSSPIYWMAKDFGYFMNIKTIYTVIILISFLILATSTLLSKPKITLIYFSIAFLSFTHLIMDFDYFVIQKDFTHKIALKKFSKVINDKKLSAGPAHAFSFYSTCKPEFVPISFYKQHTEELEEKLLEKLRKEESYRIEHIYKTQENYFIIGDTTILDKSRYIVLDKVTQKDGRYSICLLKDLE